MRRLLQAFDAMARPTSPTCGSNRRRPGGPRRRLLPALALARIDGKSPVEYLGRPREQDLVRALARPLILQPVDRTAAVAMRWRNALATG